MVVSAHVGRLWQGVRRWRAGTSDRLLSVNADLPEGDLRRIRKLVDEIIDARGGEVAARRRARMLGVTYAGFSEIGQQRFFDMLASDYGNDTEAVDATIDAVIHADSPVDRRAAEAELRSVLEPRRERLMRRFVGLEGGLSFLVQLREDVRDLTRAGGRDHEGLITLDSELRSILDSWFDVGLLTLTQITWSTPAAFLEKLIEYEAVHAIQSWNDLKARLGPGRRCYAYVHPAMTDDPLIFVEVALTEGMAGAVTPLIEVSDGPPRTEIDRRTASEEENRYDTAIFYSISNCHRGLAGVSLGDFLIKSVVEELTHDLPELRRFATLSPLPGFRRWLLAELDSGRSILTDRESSALADAAMSPVRERLAELVGGPMPSADDTRLAAVKPVLMRLGAEYVVNQRRPSGRALDPVTHFHLSNGARAERLNWLANPTEVGWDRGLAMMINYRYELRNIESNHDRYVSDGIVTASDELTKLLAANDG